MFTWNLLYISKMRLEDTLNQLMVGGGADARLFEIGEFLTFHLSRAIYMNWVRTSQGAEEKEAYSRHEHA